MRAFAVSTDGAQLHIEQQGLTPGAVFIHGQADDLHTWDGVWAALGKDFPALRYDLRGYGASSVKRPRPFTHAKDLLTIVDALAIERCDLVGVSLGGGIALNFTLDHPERVGNLILISPHLVAWEWSESWLSQWNPIVESARVGNMAQAKRLWCGHPLFATTRESPGREALFESIMRYSGAQWLRDDHEPLMPDVERLHLLKTRTLLLSGGRDLDEFRLMADLIAASASGLRRIDFAERGHLLHLEDPAGCALQIKRFLARS